MYTSRILSAVADQHIKDLTLRKCTRSEKLLSSVFVPSSRSPGGGLVGHLRNVLFHSVISSPPSFCRPRAVRKVRPPSIDIGSLLATPPPLPPFPSS